MEYVKIRDVSYFIAILLLVSAFLSLAACGPESSEKPVPEVMDSEGQNVLIVKKDLLYFRAQPGENGEVLMELPKGSKLLDLGEVADFFTGISIKGQKQEAPWLKVRTDQGREGWVMALPSNFSMKQASPLEPWLQEKRLMTLFGTDYLKKIRDYQKRFYEVSSVQDFKEIYTYICTFRDTLLDIVDEKRIRAREMPDLFWIKEALPALTPQLVDNGTAYHFFIDYKPFVEKVNATKGTADDDFLDICLSMYPEDSIEYFFPVWQIGLDETEVHSLLGSGFHWDIFRKLELLIQNSDIFAPEAFDIKNQLINDISLPETTYWGDSLSVISELDSIINANFTILTDEDRIALKVKRQLLEASEANGIKLNVRSGI